MPTDPVCGMYVPATTNLVVEKDGTKYYFCSKSCLQKFTSPETEASKLKNRLIVGWSLSIPIIAITFTLSFQYKNFLLLALAVPVQFYSGYDFYVGAYHSIRHRASNMDLLVTMGTLIAFFFSLAITLNPEVIPGSPVFYDASSFIITMILMGNYIETFTKKNASGAASKLLELIPATSRLQNEGGGETEVSTGDLKVGDVISVRAGEVFPVDGTVESGSTEVDESSITGEQEPVLKAQGAKVTSGTMNLNGSIKVRVEKTGENSTIRTIHDLLEKASFGRARVQRIADLFSRVFVPVVLAIALAVALSWLFYLGIGNKISFEVSVLSFVSVVVIACPCAIGLAGPITFLVSSLSSSKKGILIRNPGSFDRVVKINRIVFDKTGTLTEPNPTVREIRLLSDMSINEVLVLSATLERNSNHPIAKAIVGKANESLPGLPNADQVKETPGKGISGTVNGKMVEIFRHSDEVYSSVKVLVDGKDAAIILLEYRVRESAKAVVDQVRKAGLKTSIVTGDSINEGERIARMLGIDEVHAEVDPKGKADIIMKYQREGEFVLFVGDGINDSIAVEVADVGVAMGSGTDIARESGDFILLNNDLGNVLKCITIGQKTLAKVKQNLGWAVGYNTVLIPVGAGVLVPVLGLGMFTIMPMFSSLAMGLSSTSVVINSLLLRRKLDSV